MGGAAAFAHHEGDLKIKGGKWTVARFFLVSVAFTAAWLAVSSQLGWYRAVYGPQSLLLLNLAYCLPSIPLLVVSSYLDKPLEKHLGVARTILVRLVVGLVGYGAVCGFFPFLPATIWHLLGAVIALGVFGGIAFSAAYQLVSRFANKNVIALGLGCSASGPVVLLVEVLLGIGHSPTQRQQVLLYEIMALLVAAGLWATASLLLRHWDAIEAHATYPQDAQLQEPLLLQRQQEEGRGDGTATPPLPGTPTHALTPLPERGLQRLSGGSATPPSVSMMDATVWKQTSLPSLLATCSLDPYQACVLSTDEEVVLGTPPSCTGQGSLAAAAAASPAAATPVAALRPAWAGGAPSPLLWTRDGPAFVGAAAASGGKPGLAGIAEFGGRGGVSLEIPALVDREGATAALVEAAAAEAPATAGGAVEVAGGGQAALRRIWAPLTSLCLSSTIALTLFPLFTYVPTSGLLGESLPKVIFFVRIFADVLGRFLPRLRPLVAESPLTPLALACGKLAAVPVFLLYLRSPPEWHSDVAAVAFVAMLWTAGGYVNTMSNMLAPKLVPPQLKGTAAGIMAIGFQAAHFVGLALSVLSVLLLFGGM